MVSNFHSMVGNQTINNFVFDICNVATMLTTYNTTAHN
uniref:Uncharacterized protein n=1 Tax=Aegilops tauschii subsp. strangulata TaxID=200361 RepID=A0A452ZXQ6_AEGTS